MQYWLNTASNICLIIFVILTMIKIHFLEKQIKELENDKKQDSQSKKEFYCKNNGSNKNTITKDKK